jgi:hypothetical protein
MTSTGIRPNSQPCRPVIPKRKRLVAEGSLSGIRHLILVSDKACKDNYMLHSHSTFRSDGTMHVSESQAVIEGANVNRSRRAESDDEYHHRAV